MGLAALIPLVAMAGCGLAGIGSPSASPVLVGYLRDLVSRNYSAAYEASTLPLSVALHPNNPSTVALSRAHFAAFEARDPVLSFRVVQSYRREIEVEIHRQSGVSTETLELNGDRVQIGVQVATLDVGEGPLPSLFVDGVLAKVTPRPQPLVTGFGPQDRFDNLYVFAIIDGEHLISVPEGSATAAFSKMIGPTNFEMSIALQPSAKAIQSARAILARWATSCGSSCVLGTCYWIALFPPVVDGKSFRPSGYRVVSRGRTGRSIVLEGAARSRWGTVHGGLVIDVSSSGTLRLAAACFDA